MAYDPKKKVQRMLKAMKRAATKVKKIRTESQKQLYLEKQAQKMDKNPTGLESAFIEMLNELKIVFGNSKNRSRKKF